MHEAIWDSVLGCKSSERHFIFVRCTTLKCFRSINIISSFSVHQYLFLRTTRDFHSKDLKVTFYRTWFKHKRGMEGGGINSTTEQEGQEK